MATVTDGQLRSSGRSPARAGAPVVPVVSPHPAGDSHYLRFTVPARPSRAATVRRRVADHLVRLRLSAEQCDSVVLATDELFTNAVTHAHTGGYDTVTLTVDRTGDTVRVMVADPSPVPPLPRTADDAAESGRGLALVTALADTWGVAPPEPGKPGKRVWFTLGTGVNR